MENFIIILVFIGALIYNLYRNFQKEMEKSKSRRPNVRPQTIPVEPIQKPIKEVKNKEIKKQNIEEPYRPELPAEVLAAQEIRRQNKIEKPIPVIRPQDTKSEKSVVDFDLRQAVIQSAILERPYQ